MTAVSPARIRPVKTHSPAIQAAYLIAQVRPVVMMGVAEAAEPAPRVIYVTQGSASAYLTAQTRSAVVMGVAGAVAVAEAALAAMLPVPASDNVALTATERHAVRTDVGAAVGRVVPTKPAMQVVNASPWLVVEMSHSRVFARVLYSRGATSKTTSC